MSDLVIHVTPIVTVWKFERAGQNDLLNNPSQLVWDRFQVQNIY